MPTDAATRSVDARGRPVRGATGHRERPHALHVCTRYLRGGSERRIADVIAALPDVDHHVVVGGESDLRRAVSELAPATVSHEPALVKRPSPGTDVLALVRLVRVLRQRTFDVIYTHQSKAGAIGRTAAWLAGGPPTIHSLSMANFGPGYGRLEDATFRVVERLLAPHTAAYSVVGRDLALRYETNGVPGAKLAIVRSGVPLPRAIGTPADIRGRLEQRYSIPVDRPVILYLGSLDERKQVMSLPDYLARVTARSPRRPCLVIAGDGPLQAPLRERFATTGQADDVRLLGFVRPVDDLVSGADLVVLLSRAEGLPQVLVQAAAVGTPFVSYAVDGAAELMDLGAVASVVPLNDLEAATEATVTRLTVPARQRSAVPRPALEEWSRDAITQRHRRLFEQTMNPSGGGRVRPVTRTVPRAAGRGRRTGSSGASLPRGFPWA